MQKLEYKKINDNLITIDLHNEYTVIAILSWQHEEHNYDVTLMLKENTTDMWDLIEKAEHLTFEANYKNIYKAVLKQVADLLTDGFFAKYIERYEYEINCFDRGNELYEKERLGLNV